MGSSYVGFEDGFVPLLNILQKIYSKTTIYINKLISTPVNPFDIKYKELNAQISYFAATFKWSSLWEKLGNGRK